MDKYIAGSAIAITTITLLFSWIVCGCVMSKLKQLGKVCQSINIKRVHHSTF